MLADNCLAIGAAVTFTAAACGYFRKGWVDSVESICISLVLFVAYLYIFDSSNQARDAEEDRVNKPHRPIPMGLLTPSEAMHRFWLAMPIYTLLGFLSGTIEWTLLWQGVTVFLNLLSHPRQYFYVKPVAMLLGTIAQLAAAWQLVGPIDRTGWTWVLTVSIGFNLALIFEDVRDMDGDRRIGRRTLALMLGHWPVRIWFFVVMVCLPAFLHGYLFAPARGAGSCDNFLRLDHRHIVLDGRRESPRVQESSL
ncbi:UbiA family prenyltransferase [Streptomyces sp. IBSNAI002]|uniref:UbiA family prenyltransferase n=1 Tax=Streptomyces sp. IBSNAI002 TaxID=3457500 RepID=UPI003FD164AA